MEAVSFCGGTEQNIKPRAWPEGRRLAKPTAHRETPKLI